MEKAELAGKAENGIEVVHNKEYNLFSFLKISVDNGESTDIFILT